MSNKIFIRKSSEYKTTKWSGGLTREIFIYPEDNNYSDRNFTCRVSSASVDVEKSTFTKLADYNRILMILKGELTIQHNKNEKINMQTFSQDYFDGADDTVSVGKVVDFNLMMRKGKCSGDVVYMEIKGEVKFDLEERYKMFVVLNVDGEDLCIWVRGLEYKVGKFDSLIMKENVGEIKVKSQGANIVVTKINF